MGTNEKITRVRQIAKDYVRSLENWSDEKAVSKAIEYMGEIYHLLDGPLRNCEKYATIEKATEAFLKEACEDPCGNCTVGDSLIHECGIRWLFDKAKGETDGSK